MLSFIKKIFGSGPSVNYKELVEQGAIILDVRSPGEYSGGHVKGSVNMPLQQLSGQLHKLKNKNQTIITCCASGMRSASARGILMQNGYTQVYNGGGWYSLQSKLQ